MLLKSIIKFAWKNLLAHRLRTILTVGAVSIGMAAIIFLISVGFGLEKLVTSDIANFDAFTIIDVTTSSAKTIKLSDEAINKIQKNGHIASIDSIIDLAGKVKLGSQDSVTETPVVVTDPGYFKLAQIDIDSGIFYAKDNTRQVVINKALSAMLGYSKNPKDIIGKTVALDLIIPNELMSDTFTEDTANKTLTDLRVVGLIPENKSAAIYIPLKSATDLGVVNKTSLKVKVDNQKDVPQSRKAIENIGFTTEYVGDTVQQITQVFGLFRIVLGGFGLVALLVAALGTFNILTISLMERIREVGLLKTLGMKNKVIFKLFIVESMTIGVIGGIVGIIAGTSVGWGLNRLLNYLATKANGEVVTIYYTPPIYFLYVIIGSMLVGFLTGFYPAYRAVKTNPLDTIRYE